MADRFDTVVVGAGIVGLATARAIRQRNSALRIAVIDKEGSIAGHQTGRNSGVLHAGVYYSPGSDKARLCATGRQQMIEFCRDNGVAVEICGKVVVAVSPSEVPRLQQLGQRCLGNGVAAEIIGSGRLREVEPFVAGVQALHVPSTGIVDFPGVCRALVTQLVAANVDLRLGCALIGATSLASGLVLHTSGGDIETAHVVNCAGLHADRIARLLGGPGAANGLMIVPFRGEYFELAPARAHLVRSLIYPVPDPQFPFLGVHLTRGFNGRVHVGPNAVLALAREGYSWRAINAHDLAETVRFSGFRTLAREHWRYGLGEMRRSLSRRVFAQALARLVPDVNASDLEPAPSGVRAQAIDANGRLVQDFAFSRSNGGRALHVLNAPSPAATASLAIGDYIATQI